MNMNQRKEPSNQKPKQKPKQKTVFIYYKRPECLVWLFPYKGKPGVVTEMSEEQAIDYFARLEEPADRRVIALDIEKEHIVSYCEFAPRNRELNWDAFDEKKLKKNTKKKMLQIASNVEELGINFNVDGKKIRNVIFGNDFQLKPNQSQLIRMSIEPTNRVGVYDLVQMNGDDDMNTGKKRSRAKTGTEEMGTDKMDIEKKKEVEKKDEPEQKKQKKIVEFELPPDMAGEILGFTRSNDGKQLGERTQGDRGRLASVSKMFYSKFNENIVHVLSEENASMFFQRLVLSPRNMKVVCTEKFKISDAMKILKSKVGRIDLSTSLKKLHILAQGRFRTGTLFKDDLDYFTNLVAIVCSEILIDGKAFSDLDRYFEIELDVCQIDSDSGITINSRNLKKLSMVNVDVPNFETLLAPSRAVIVQDIPNIRELNLMKTDIDFTNTAYPTCITLITNWRSIVNSTLFPNLELLELEEITSPSVTGFKKCKEVALMWGGQVEIFTDMPMMERLSLQETTIYSYPKSSYETEKTLLRFPKLDYLYIDGGGITDICSDSITTLLLNDLTILSIDTPNLKRLEVWKTRKESEEVLGFPQLESLKLYNSKFNIRAPKLSVNIDVMGLKINGEVFPEFSFG